MPYAYHPCPDCGRPIQNCHTRCRPCYHALQKGPNNNNWKGGRSRDNYYYKKRQVQRYPERNRARQLVCYAVKHGKLTKTACNWPGCGIGAEKTQSHHWSYEPGHELDVTDFCVKHHRQVDRMTREQFEFICAATTPGITKRVMAPKLDGATR